MDARSASVKSENIDTDLKYSAEFITSPLL